MNNSYKYDYAVFIGRFQPIHRGHEAVIRKALEVARHTILIVGSSTASRSLRNPFTFEERKTMIELSIKEMKVALPVTVVPLADSAYNFTEWLMRTKNLISSTVKNLSYLSPEGVGGPKVALFGHFKDDTSYYLNYFPEYDFIPVDTQEGGVGATAIREEIFGHEHPGYLMRYCSTAVRNWITDVWMAEDSKTSAYNELLQEYDFIKKYKRQWAFAPYSPTFVTTDNIVLCLGHILLIRRGRHPGKGLYALPGGFLNQEERIQDGAIRELKEETKIDVPKPILVNSIADNYVFDHPLRDPRGRTITHAFLIDLNLKKLPKVAASDDASMVSWIPLHELEFIQDKIYADHMQIITFFINRAR